MNWMPLSRIHIKQPSSPHLVLHFRGLVLILFVLLVALVFANSLHVSITVIIQSVHITVTYKLLGLRLLLPTICQAPPPHTHTYTLISRSISCSCYPSAGARQFGSSNLFCMSWHWLLLLLRSIHFMCAVTISLNIFAASPIQFGH